MKKQVAWGLIVLAGLWLTSPVFAKSGDTKEGKTPKHAHKFWKDKADADEDGVISDAERQATKSLYTQKREAWQKELKKFDKDGDGKLNREEKKAARAANLEKKQSTL